MNYATMIYLIGLQAKLVLRHRAFAYALFFLVAFGLFLIPGQDSTYITFSYGSYTGFPDAFWVSSLGAVFLNIVLGFVGFFLLEGTAKTEVDSGFGSLVRTSATTNLQFLVSKWGAYIVVLASFSIIGMACLFIKNYEGFGLFSFLYPFLYFTLPFIFLLAALIVLFDYGLSNRVLKISLFIVGTVACLGPLEIPIFDIFGANEFCAKMASEMLATTGESAGVGIGFNRKTGLIKYATIVPFLWKANWLMHVLQVVIAFGLILGFAVVFPRFKSKKKPAGLKEKTGSVKNQARIVSDFSFLDHKSPILNSSVLNLFAMNWKLLVHSFSLAKILVFAFVWIGAFFAPKAIANFFLIPFLFLQGFALIEQMLFVGQGEKLEAFFSTSIQDRLQNMACAGLLFLAFILFCCLPSLVQGSVIDFGESLLRSTIFVAAICLTIYFSRSIKVVEIVYMIICASYFSGFPIVELF